MSQALKLAWFERVPKVELHLHLEGAIPYDALWELVQKYGGNILKKGSDLLLTHLKKGGFNLYNLKNEKASNLLLIYKKGSGRNIQQIERSSGWSIGEETIYNESGKAQYVLLLTGKHACFWL